MYRRTQTDKAPQAACDIHKMTTQEVDAKISLPTTKSYSIRSTSVSTQNKETPTERAQSTSSKSLAPDTEVKKNKKRL